MKIPKLKTMPLGWAEVQGAITAPNGYILISNNKSRFSKKRKLALLKIPN